MVDVSSVLWAPPSGQHRGEVLFYARAQRVTSTVTTRRRPMGTVSAMKPQSVLPARSPLTRNLSPPSDTSTIDVSSQTTCAGRKPGVEVDALPDLERERARIGGRGRS